MIPGPAFKPVVWRETPLQRLHPATRLGAAVLGVVTVFAVNPLWVGLLLPALAGLLAWTGLTPGAQLRALRPWWSLAAFLIGIQTFFGNPDVPLGTPTLAGAVKGAGAVLRVGAAAAWLGLFARVSSLDDLVAGMHPWLRPLRPLGRAVEDLPLVLAVALGTAPVMLGEGRRIQSVTALRATGTRTDSGPARSRAGRRWLQGAVDRGRVVVPLLESIARRADALSLSLAQRRPTPGSGGRGLPWPEIAGLLLWVAGLGYLGLQRVGVIS